VRACSTPRILPTRTGVVALWQPPPRIAAADVQWAKRDIAPASAGSRETEGALMGVGDKMENAAEKVGGKAKEAAGKMTDDEEKIAEGKADQTKADLKQAGENVKDAFKE
jgi:uncharacterized protein YjbJ (UPF0337 family)